MDRRSVHAPGVAVLLWMLALLSGAPTQAHAADELPARCDRVEGEASSDGIYLLTMSPGAQLFSAFGHNGLYVRDDARGLDVVYNFGVFDAKDPNLLKGFLEETQEYWLGTRSFESMERLYESEDRTVVMQRLALTREQRERFITALAVEALPENRAYLYDWFAANCSTRIRDLLDDILDGQLEPQFQDLADGATQRSEILRHVARDPWVWFGLDYALSMGAERELTRWETMFLPSRLHEGLASATIVDAEGTARPAVDHSCLVREGAVPPPPAEAPSRTLWLWLIGLGLAGVMAGLGAVAPRSLAARLGLGLTMCVVGLVGAAMGAVSIWLWTSSEMEIMWRNLSLTHMSPATLLLLVAGIVTMTGWRTGLRRFALPVTAALAAVSVLGLLASAFVPQHTLSVAGVILPALLASAWSVWRLTRSGAETGQGAVEELG